MSNKPVPKPRPPPKPEITSIGKKPVVPPKPRRKPPATPAVSPNPRTSVPSTLKNGADPSIPPKRPLKPLHLMPKNKSDEKQVLNKDHAAKSDKPEEIINEDTYDDVRADAVDSVENSTINQEEFYDDVIPNSRDDNINSVVTEDNYYEDILPDSSNKPDPKSTESKDINSNNKKHINVSRMPPPTKPPPKLPPKPESTQQQKDTTEQDKEQEKVIIRKRPQLPPKPRWVKALSKVVDQNNLCSSSQEEPSSLENPNPSDGSTSQLCDVVENNKLDDEQTANHCTNDGALEGAVVITEPATGSTDPITSNKPEEPEETITMETNLTNEMPIVPSKNEHSDKSIRVNKKRLATRRQNPGKSTPLAVSIPDIVKRRPPPPPPEDGSPPKRTGSLKGPEIPKDHLKFIKGKQKTSAENIPKTAEEQSLYSYAYDHTIPSNCKATKDSTANDNNAISQDESYVEPDTTAVAGFMEELKNKNISSVSDLTYEIPAEEGIESQETCISEEAEYIQPEDIIKDEGSESSSSNGEPDYEVPPESPPPIPPHRSPLRSGSYDVTSPDEDDDDESDDDDDDDESDGYAEPPDAYGSSLDEESDFESDTFIGDEASVEEPLYQVYTARTLKRDRTLSRKLTDSSQNETSFEDITKGTLRNMRMLWCELPDVIASGILETIDANERKRQEAMFEVITSEASYLKSLKILESHFINSPALTPGTSQSVIEKAQHHILFSNVKIVVEGSQRFLDRLRQRSSESLVVSTISDIIDEFASKEFEVYVKYCSNQIYQDRVFKELRQVPRFLEGIEKLEKSAAAQSLSLQSFLVLPMQRITRLPLLVDAICHRCEPGSDEFLKTDAALKAVHKIVRDCNEGARKMERMEEMMALQPQIEFTSKPIALVSANRWLLRRGEIVLVIEQSRSPISKKKLKLKPVYMFLFNDLLLITKKKGENRYRVLDYAARNMTKVEESRDQSVQLDYMLSLILLENCNNKTKDFILCAESETDKTRWLEAFNPPKAEREGEKVYGDWDCPQVQAIHDYTPQQPDELALHEGDVINVQRKLPDGWHYGERLCDGVCGWFPANYTENILNEHVRARNLLQRYRLLAASKHLIGAVQTMKTPKSSKLTLKALSATLKEPKRDAFS